MRRAFFLLMVVVALIAFAFGFQQWEQHRQRTEAQDVISEATALTRELEERSDYQQLRREFFAAWEDLEAARQANAEQRYGIALTRGTRSLLEYQRILQRDQAVGATQGRFVSVAGGVEYRRGERGAWKRARPGDQIDLGDWVKTSAAGSARILFPDGSEYTLRNNTMVHLSAQTSSSGRREQVAEMAFGWVELSTDQQASRVKTPKSEASVRQSSEAMVAYDRERDTSSFAAYQGSVDIVADGGEETTLGALQQVEQVADKLSAPTSLPAGPRLQSPSDERQLVLEARELTLDWSPVSGAARYLLQVSNSPLFASRLIDDERTKTSARIGLRGEGVFYWQVSALGADGVRGPWSTPRSFSIGRRQSPRGDDDVPPPLEIDDLDTYGRLLMVHGRTESGATVTVNGQKAIVGIDGSFNLPLLTDTEGFMFVDLVATDASGNTTTEQRRVFIDAS